MGTPGTAANPSDAKSHAAYVWIKDGIVSGRFTPGYRLVMHTIAAELGISAVPVREALRLLQAEGFVELNHHKGAAVARIDEAGYVDIMQTLAVIEAAATAQAAPHIGQAAIGSARSINDALTATLGAVNPRSFTDGNQRFHRLLYAACPNRVLRDLADAQWQALAMVRSSTFAFIPDRAGESVSEHGHILRLIEDAAPADVIENAVRNHRLATLDAYLGHTTQ